MHQLHLFILCFLLFSGNAFSEKPVIKIYGDNEYAPYAYVEDEQFKGIYPHILNRLFSEIKDYKITLIPINWKRGLALLKANKTFALFPPYRWPERRPFITRYSRPILKEKLAVYCQHQLIESKNFSRFPEDFFGLSFANTLSFLSAGKDFFDAVEKNKITLHETKGIYRNLVRLATRQSDCFVNNKRVIEYNVFHYDKYRSRNLKGMLLKKKVRHALNISEQFGHIGYNENFKTTRYDIQQVIQTIDALIERHGANNAFEQWEKEYLERELDFRPQ